MAFFYQSARPCHLVPSDNQQILAQQRHALFWLVFWHIVVIASSNYWVQIPFSIGNIHNTWGAFTFPFIFLTTDLTVRIFGRDLARRIIFGAMFPALAVSYVFSQCFHDGHFVGMDALFSLNTVALRIALASFTGYCFGQLLDIALFDRLRRLQSWWVAPVASTILGSALDTVLFFSIAFYHSSDSFMAEHWVQIALMDYLVKLLISGLFFLPAYAVLLKVLLRRLTKV